MANLTVEEYVAVQNLALVEIAEHTTKAQNNNSILQHLQDNLNTNADDFESELSSQDQNLQTLGIELPNTDTSIDELLVKEAALIQQLQDTPITIPVRTYKMPGNTEYFYPIRIHHPNRKALSLEIWRNSGMESDLFGGANKTPAVYLKILYLSPDSITKRPGHLTIRKLDEVNDLCIGLIDPKLYCSKTIDSTLGFYNPDSACIWLRGGLTYHFRFNGIEFGTGLEADVENQTGQYTWDVGDSQNRYAIPIDFEKIYNLEWSENMWPGQDDNQYKTTGSTAVIVGGLLSTDNTLNNSIEQMDISTSTSTIKTGELTKSSYKPQVYSNGALDIGVVSGGKNPVDAANYASTPELYHLVISSAAVANQFGTMAEPSYGAAVASNGTDDIMNSCCGVYLNNSKDTSIWKSVISTGVDVVDSGNTSKWLNGTCGVSNDTNDIMNVTGGWDAGADYTHLSYHVISTASSGVTLSALENRIMYHRTVSNGINDKAITIGGVDRAASGSPAWLLCMSWLISNGAARTTTPNLWNKAKYYPAATSNKTGEIAMNFGGSLDGGAVLSSDIEKTIISTLASAEEIGNLLHTRTTGDAVSNS
ncbi:MAG: hypothetical protein GY804_09035 [Alphaproteobacteria bacterium]|nr:hypothetical protein [Alphaproteobacteria bacterium]